MRCQSCEAPRKRLFRCVTCGKKLCGICSFRSWVGRVCPGECHKGALARAKDG
jgi:hypothetical protein